MKSVTHTTNTVETRPLSYIEKFGTGWMSPAVHFTFSGPFTRELITDAMKKVRWSNPLLRCSISNGCIVTISAVDSLKEQLPISLHHVSTGSDERFKQAAHCAYERMGFNMVPRNLWHMTFFYDHQGCEMVFQIHHSILDGMSWFSVAKDFLAICEGKILEPKSLNLAMESIYPKHAQAIQGKEPFSVQEWFEIAGTEPQIQPIFTSSVLTRLPQEAVIALKKSCKDHGITVHAALMAAYLFATDNQLPKLYSDVSTRRWCEPALDPISPGVYIGQVVWATHVDKDKSFWENAARLIKELNEKIAAGVHLSSNAECSSTSIGPEIFSITNMAPPEIPRGKFALEYSTMEFATGTSVEIPSFPVIFSIMTSNTICNLRLHYHKSFWSSDQAESILRKMGRILIEEGAGLKSENLNIFSQPENMWNFMRSDQNKQIAKTIILDTLDTLPATVQVRLLNYQIVKTLRNAFALNDVPMQITDEASITDHQLVNKTQMDLLAVMIEKSIASLEKHITAVTVASQTTIDPAANTSAATKAPCVQEYLRLMELVKKQFANKPPEMLINNQELKAVFKISQ